MKRFKDLLNEFRGSIDNTGNGGSSSGGDEGYNYIHRKIKDFMKKTPFHYRTLDGHDLHFHSSLDAARMVADAQGMHTAALGHLKQLGEEPNTETPEEIQRRKMMIQYFGKSSGTHHAVMGALESHILNHRDFPEHYHPHLGTVIAQIENEHHPDNLENVAKRALSTHIPKLITSQHPHLNDTAHHLQDLIQTVESEDSGYFLRKEEQA